MAKRTSRFLRILLTLQLAALYACERPISSLAVIENDKLILDTNWPYSPRWSGAFHSGDGSNPMIFSGDPLTHLLVRVFNHRGTALFDIPLNNALDSLGSINSFTLIGADLLFVIEEHGPHYAIVDRRGNVNRFGSIAELLCDQYGDLYEVNGYSGGLALLDGRIILETDWISKCSDTAEAKPLPLAEVHRQYFAEATSKCKVASLDLSGSHGHLLFGGCNILPHLTDTPRCTIGGVRRVVANERLFVISPYSSKILELVPSTLLVTRELNIELDGMPVGITPPPVNAEDVRTQGYNLRLATKATIAGIAYDSASGKYVVTVYHEVPESSDENARGVHREWSLSTYDADFNSLGTKNIVANSYMPGCLLTLDNGVWILVDQPGDGDARVPKVFHRMDTR